ncbi:MAG TPA: cytochrome C peroxidase [Verrucomicrobiales bacterium]|nr:cytochrome C peroxidase [Verrucomicrobiales bacterium]
MIGRMQAVWVEGSNTLEPASVARRIPRAAAGKPPGPEPGGKVHGGGLALLVFTLCLCNGWAPQCFAQGQSLRLELEHRAGERPLQFNSFSLTNTSGTPLTVSRLDYLLSGLSLRRTDGTWLESRDWYAYVSPAAGRTSATIRSMPAEKFEAVRFHVGVAPAINAGDPNLHPADHDLHPQINGLHWGWSGGYVFLAAEGHWLAADRSTNAYSFHVANDENLMTVELPVQFDTAKDTTITLAMDMGSILDGTTRVDFAAQSSTHSRQGDALAGQLAKNIERAFSVVGVASDLFHPPAASPKTASLPAGTRSFDLRVAQRLPRPPLPEDNPLTKEGVELGRRLFFEKRLSRDDSLACAGCHQQPASFTDPGRPISLGVDGRTGTRNSMPLHNLVWADSFFWDGRVKRLREQVLLPIEDPLEMDQSLEQTMAKLRADAEYPGLFQRAFGSAGIDAARLGLALEQFLITLISQDSRFDRAIRGELQFTEQEKRGFELFVTENDPARGLFGADCFHCHGGSLFTNHRFANNGLDGEFQDTGRFQVTGDDADRGKFKTPSLRNVELTAPYMHDGRFETLEAVVAHYDHGVRPSPTLDPNLAKHLPGGLKLKDADRAALVAFLKTLTDRDFGQGAVNPP